MRYITHHLLGISLGITGFLVFIIIYFQLWYTASLWVNDQLFAPSQSATPITIVAIDDTSLKAIGRWPWPRDTQAKLIQAVSAKNPQVIGYDITIADSTTEDEELQDTVATTPNLVLPQNAILTGGLKGHVEVNLDPDGKVRTIPLQKQTIPAFSKLVAQLVGKPIHLDTLRVNYHLKAHQFPTIPAANILNNTNTHDLANSIVLIGITAPELQDVKLTPVGLMAGVEIHANAIQTLLTNTPLTTTPIPIQMFGGLILAYSAFVLVTKRRWHVSVLVMMSLLCSLIVASQVSFRAFNHMLPLLYWVISTLLGFFAATIWKTTTTGRESRFIKKAFSQYVSPQVLADLEKHPEHLSLHGQLKPITILFLDIRGFTPYAEKHSPEEVVRELNYLLKICSEIILKHEGTIDKFIGDAVMAFWGAPLPDPLQASHACLAAIEIEQTIRANTSFKVGIGIHSGSAIVGNIGSENRFDYTAIGDAVNLAARIESATKQLQKTVLISQTTDRLLKAENAPIASRETATITLKGKSTPQTLYSLARRNGVKHVRPTR